MMKQKKSEIIRNFSEAAAYYEEHAGVQQQTAERLARALEPWQYSVPDGPLIEIGSGTGFLSRYLLQMFKSHPLEITDASERMVRFCRDKFSGRDNASFRQLDAEQYDWPEESYSLITGNFVAQWFADVPTTLSKMAKALKPGGFMLMSFPGSESYPNWRKYCLELGLPFTANPLPDVEQIVVHLSMGPVKVDFYEDQSSEEYADLYSFFRHLKHSGTSTNFSGKRLTPKQLRLLNDYWLKMNDGKINVHYHTAFIAVKRDL
jgi:malonyl-CoA O-methyltransferase